MTIRTQWCHGAPGIVASLASLVPADSQLSELLVAGGELTWHAGPLRKGANLCHGTAGNGYAFLKLFERIGDDLWLHRARSFAMHAIEQVEHTAADYGRGRHTLWTGDRGHRPLPLELRQRDRSLPDARHLLSVRISPHRDPASGLADSTPYIKESRRGLSLTSSRRG